MEINDVYCTVQKYANTLYTLVCKTQIGFFYKLQVVWVLFKNRHCSGNTQRRSKHSQFLCYLYHKFYSRLINICQLKIRYLPTYLVLVLEV